MKGHHYYGFISHRGPESDFTAWLQKTVERYAIPRSVRKEYHIKNRRLRYLCMDRTSFAGTNLREIDEKLEKSDKLILVCSKLGAGPVEGKTDWSAHPETVDWLADGNETGWIGYEIVRFMQFESHKPEDIILVLYDGDPKEGDCFHPVLWNYLDRKNLKWFDFRRHRKTPRAERIGLIAAILPVKDREEVIQRDRARQRFRIAAAAAGTVILAAAGAWCYDYFVPHTGHYSDYVLKGGLPQGIGQLNDNETGVEHYVLTTQKSQKMTILQHVNAHNVPCEDASARHTDAPIIARYKCRDSGTPDTVEYLDRNGTVVMSYAYSTDMRYVSFQENAFTSEQVYPAASENEYGIPIRLKIDRFDLSFDDQNRLVRKMYMSGVNYAIDDLGVAGEAYTYDTDGRLLSVRYLNRDREPSPNLNGIAGYSLSYDETGRLVRQSWLRSDGSVTYGPEQYAYSLDTYSEDNLLVRREFLDTNEKPVINSSGYSSVTYEYNAQRDNVTVSCFGLSGEPIFSLDGYQKVIREYNENGDILRESYLGPDGEPVLCSNGYASVKRAFDENGNVLSVRYYNQDGTLISASNRAAVTLRRVNERGCELEEENLDEEENRVITAEGYCIRRVALDDHDRPTEIAYFGTDEKPVYHKNGYHCLQFKYDDRGNMIETRALDLNGHPVPFSGFWAVQKMKYNGGGCVTEVSYEDQSGNPVMVRGGYASIVNKYDDAGYLISSTYLDETGSKADAAFMMQYAEIVNTDRRYASIKFEYDENGRVIREIHYDKDDNLENSPLSPFAIRETAYDEVGHKTRQICYGPDEQPMNDGTSEIRWTYDENGNMTSVAYFNAATGEAAEPLSLGYHRKEDEYDFRHKIVLSTLYSASGEFTQHRTRYMYNANGLIAGEEYLNQDGLPQPVQSGYSKITCEYDDRNRKIRIVWRDPEGNPVNSEYGIAVENRQYDELGNRIGTDYQNQDGNPAAHSGYGYAALKEKLNSWRNTLRADFLDETGRLLLRYEAEYLDNGYKTSEAIYGSDGELLGADLNVARCDYEYDAMHYRTGGSFYGEDGALILIGGQYAGYSSDLENGREVSRLYYGTNHEPVMIAEGFARVTMEYDDSGREIRRAFFGTSGEPVCTIFGFQAYDVSYTNSNQIADVTYYDADGNRITISDGSVKIVTLTLNGEMDMTSAIPTQRNAVYVKRLAFVDNNDHYDLLLTPEINLSAMVSTARSRTKLLDKSRKRLAPDLSGDAFSLEGYPDAEEWKTLLSAYIMAVSEGDTASFMDALAMDYQTAALDYLNALLGADVSREAFEDFYRDFYEKELAEYKAALDSQYGPNRTWRYDVLKLQKATKSEIDATNESIRQTFGEGAVRIEDCVMLTIRFHCTGNEREGDVSSGFLYPSFSLLKINGVWKAGSSDGLPSPANADLLRLFMH